jgi:hypothetical protein
MRMMQEDQGPGEQEYRPSPVMMALEGSDAGGTGLDSLKGAGGGKDEEGAAWLMMNVIVAKKIAEGGRQRRGPRIRIVSNNCKNCKWNLYPSTQLNRFLKVKQQQIYC